MAPNIFLAFKTGLEKLGGGDLLLLRRRADRYGDTKTLYCSAPPALAMPVVGADQTAPFGLAIEKRDMTLALMDWRNRQGHSSSVGHREAAWNAGVAATRRTGKRCVTWCRTAAKLVRRLSVGLLVVGSSAAADNFRLDPYKDDLFGYHNVIGTKHGGDLVFVEFSDERDQKQRDEVELKKVRPEYVALEVNDNKKDLVLKGQYTVRYVGVGKTEGGAKIVVIFLHGLHGDRTLAMVDWRFGGNFNRLKNLMNLNEGAYLSPDFSNFREKGKNEIKALIKHSAEISPDAPIILACASTSCKIIFRLLADPEAVDLIGGVVLLGSLTSGNDDDETFFDSPAFKDPSKRIPIYIGHGSDDPTVSWVTQELFFRKVKAGVPDYPIRFDLFVTAVHGTPIRMIDWRMVLNWMLKVNGV